MENNACECAYTPTRRDKLRRFYGSIKHWAYMKWHGFYWKVLHLTGLTRPYSVAMCKLNWYSKFMDGRCQWCGNDHRKGKA
jgi:hypothetical protein